MSSSLSNNFWWIRLVFQRGRTSDNWLTVNSNRFLLAHSCVLVMCHSQCTEVNTHPVCEQGVHLGWAGSSASGTLTGCGDVGATVLSEGSPGEGGNILVLCGWWQNLVPKWSEGCSFSFVAVQRDNPVLLAEKQEVNYITFAIHKCNPYIISILSGGSNVWYKYPQVLVTSPQLAACSLRQESTAVQLWTLELAACSPQAAKHSRTAVGFRVDCLLFSFCFPLGMAAPSYLCSFLSASQSPSFLQKYSAEKTSP